MEKGFLFFIDESLLNFPIQIFFDTNFMTLNSILSELTFLPLGHGGFGINTNIFETNILNLAAVVAVVVSFVGGNLTSLLDDRKKTILNNLQEASQRAAEAEEKLIQAKNQLEMAKKKANEIREEGQVRATQEVQNCVTQHEERLSKLEEFKQETLQFYQQKAFKQSYVYVISRIMSRVKERLNKGLDPAYHVVVNNFYVSRFTEYNP